MSHSVRALVNARVCEQEMLVLKVNLCVLACKVSLLCVLAGVLTALEILQFPGVCWS